MNAPCRTILPATLLGLVAFGNLAVPVPSSAQNTLPLANPVVSTVPANGDLNPYGVAFTPRGILSDGVLQNGDILVSNFNNSANLQGTGTTILRVTQKSQLSTFYTGLPGLTAALGVVHRGFVFIGNLPTTDGTPNTVQPGALSVLDRWGHALANLTGPKIQGPWGMAIRDDDTSASVFVSNVLNGTITRLDVQFAGNSNSFTVKRTLTIGTGFTHRTDPGAIVLGPSGLLWDRQHDLLYVASSTDNAIYTIPQASSRTTAAGGSLFLSDAVHLHGPLMLAVTPAGHLLVANSDGSNAEGNQPSEIVEYTAGGEFVVQFSLDPNTGGAFGIAVANLTDDFIRIAAVDDNTAQLTIYTQPSR